MKGSRFLAKANDPAQNWLMYFFVGVLGLGVLGNGVANLILEDLGGWLAVQSDWPKWIIQMGLLILIALLIFLGIYQSKADERLQSLLSGRVQSQTNVVPLKETYFGLIAIASKPIPNKESSAEAAFKFHWQQGQGNLRYCWLICTQDVVAANQERFGAIATQSTHTATPITLSVDSPLQTIRNAGRTVQLQFIVIDWPSAQDPNFVKQLVDQIYRQAKALSVEAQSIIADYTGGVKSTSAGVILACSTPERHLQYAGIRRDDAGNSQTSEMMEVKLSYQLKFAKD